MSRKSTSLSWRITNEQVMEALRYFSGKQLKAEQTKLSSAATQLEKLTAGNLAKFLDLEEQEIIQRAAKLVRDLNVRVEHAKETKVREEKRVLREQEAYSAATAKAVMKRFPEVTNDDPDLPNRLLGIVELHLGLIHSKFLDDYWSDGKPAHFRKDFDRWQSGQITLMRLVNTSLYELRRDLEDRINWMSHTAPDPALALHDALETASSVRSEVRRKNSSFFERFDRLLAEVRAASVERLQTQEKPGAR